MQMPNDHILYLWQQYVAGKATPAELDQLFAHIRESANDEENLRLFQQSLVPYPANTRLSEETQAEMWQRIQQLTAEPSFDGAVVRPMTTAPSERRLPVLRRWWWAAASIVLAVGLGGYFILFNKIEKPTEIVTTSPTDVEAPKDTRAIITLADGRTVAIDSVTRGLLAQQSSVTVTKTADGKIVYTGNADEVVYNTLTNPRGSKVIDMTLSDGSHVWLNAGSSVTYPVAFVANERKVSITGEAYFEVAHDAAKPFYVSKGDMQVQVLGTHFNVNAYDDESDIKVTLLEGSVKVSSGNNEGLLMPGQQAQIAGNIKVINNTDVQQVMAWKNGLFSFEKADIKTIMKEVSRWYDVDVVYAKDVNELFRLKTSRNTNVSNIFKILETTGKVHFKVEGKTITVQP